MNYTQNKIFLVLFGIASLSNYSRCHHFPPSQRNNGRYYDERYGESWRKETAEDREEYRQNKEEQREKYRQKRERQEIDRERQKRQNQNATQRDEYRKSRATERQKQREKIDNLEERIIELQKQLDKKEK